MPSIDLTTLLAVALLVYAWWPGQAGRTRWTGRLVALCLLSPVLRYLSALFTFPIRLQLSAWAGQLLRLAGLNVQVDGNVLITTGQNGPVEMAVDPACMGLQLTGASLLVGLFALIWQERTQQKKVSLGRVVAYEGLVFGLTLGCNLFRIVLLVAFHAMPGSWAHEIIGLACVALYAWLPSWIAAWWLVKRLGEPEVASSESTAAVFKSARWGFGLLAVGVSLRALAALPNESVLDAATAQKLVPKMVGHTAESYSCKTLPNGFRQYAKPGLLIYLKPQSDWFSADHSPMACWRGSGYELQRVRETTFDGHPAYIGELRKKGRVLYTAWWFSNGTLTTVSQFTMRGQMLWGKTGFVLVNVTADESFR